MIASGFFSVFREEVSSQKDRISGRGLGGAVGRESVVVEGRAGVSLDRSAGSSFSMYMNIGYAS